MKKKTIVRKIVNIALSGFTNSEMFAKATAHFLEEVDPTGNLIPVSSCNDSFNVLSIVRKKKGGLLFQKTKYVATGFTLNDILIGDTLIQPGMHNSQYSHLQLKMFSF
jgi:hypothetical protein